jgi:hypothetical protein
VYPILVPAFEDHIVVARLHLTRIGLDEAPALEQYEDRTVFQMTEWVRFISDAQDAEPVVAILEAGDRLVGRFTGLIKKRYGLGILGSPFPGWTTSYMGFNLEPSIPRIDALQALKGFAFGDLNCVHVEICDRRLNIRDLEQAGYRYRIVSGFEVDLSHGEESLIAAMTPECRRCIRKAAKMGVRIEGVRDCSFVDDYYSQLEDVFAKQRLVPTYSKERVRSLIEHLHPTGQLLLARARDSAGNCIATGIFPALHDTMYFWGGASWRQHQHLRPNEAMQLFAMLYWKSRGIAKYDMGGSGEYKRKYGGNEISVPWGRISRYPILENLRNLGKHVAAVKQRVAGLGKH